MKREITSIDFGEWMMMKRKSHKWKQRDLANKANCHENSIGRWERGEATPTLEQAEHIVKLFGAELVIRENDEERV